MCNKQRDAHIVHIDGQDLDALQLPRAHQDRRLKGYTLVELLVVVAVVGIAAVIGIPGLNATLTENRMAAQTNEFITTLNLARSEAVKRGRQVVVRKNATEWEQGWTVFFDADESSTFNDDGDGTPCESNEDCLLVVQAEPLAGASTLRTAASGNYSSYLAFNGLGTATGNAGGNSREFRICGSDHNINTARTISVETSGHLSLTRSATVCP